MKVSMDSKFFIVTNKIVDMIVLSLVWLLMCIPILTIIPSTIALYYATAKSVRQDAGHAVPEFFHAFKENLRQGIALDIIYLAIGAALYGVRVFYNAEGLSTNLGKFYYVFFAVMVICVIAVTFYLIPVLSRFSVTLFNGLRLSIYFISKSLGTTIPLLITFAGFCAAIYVFPYALVILPGFYAYLMTKPVEKSLKNYILNELPDPDEHAGKWYMD
jgi:uncharacterized membrane protein YesL